MYHSLLTINKACHLKSTSVLSFPISKIYCKSVHPSTYSWNMTSRKSEDIDLVVAPSITFESQITCNPSMWQSILVLFPPGLWSVVEVSHQWGAAGKRRVYEYLFMWDVTLAKLSEGRMLLVAHSVLLRNSKKNYNRGRLSTREGENYLEVMHQPR